MKILCLLVFLLFSQLILFGQPGPEVFFPDQLRNFDLELAKDSTNDSARMERIHINLRNHNTVQVESDLNVILMRKEAGLVDSTISYARLYELLGECYKDYVLPDHAIKFYTIDILKRFPARSDELKDFYLVCAREKFNYYRYLIANGAIENSYSIRSQKELGFDYLFSLIETHLNDNNFKQAKKLLEQLEPFIPHNSEGGILEIYSYYKYYKLWGDLYFKMRKFNKAWESYLITAENSNFKDIAWAKQLLDQFRNEPKVKVLVAKIYANNKEHEYFQDKTGDLMALTLTEEALHEGATDFQLFVIRAKHFMASNNYEYALTEMNKAMKVCPNYHWIPEYIISIYK